jgi:hypothetical protein
MVLQADAGVNPSTVMVLSLATLIANEAVSRISCGHHFASGAQAFRVKILD